MQARQSHHDSHACAKREIELVDAVLASSRKSP